MSELTPTQQWAIGITLGIITILVSGVFNQEVRYFFHLEQRPVAPQSQSPILPTSSAPAEPQIGQSSPLYGEPATKIEELRIRHHVSALRDAESDETLSEIPSSSFGFAYARLLVKPWADEYPQTIPLKVRDGYSGFLEVHKLADGQSQIAVYVGPETLERLRHGLRPGENLTIYTVPWKDASNLVAIPLSRIRCERDRTLEMGKIETVALDCRAN